MYKPTNLHWKLGHLLYVGRHKDTHEIFQLCHYVWKVMIDQSIIINSSLNTAMKQW